MGRQKKNKQVAGGGSRDLERGGESSPSSSSSSMEDARRGGPSAQPVALRSVSTTAASSAQAQRTLSPEQRNLNVIADMNQLKEKINNLTSIINELKATIEEKAKNNKALDISLFVAKITFILSSINAIQTTATNAINATDPSDDWWKIVVYSITAGGSLFSFASAAILWRLKTSYQNDTQDKANLASQKQALETAEREFAALAASNPREILNSQYLQAMVAEMHRQITSLREIIIENEQSIEELRGQVRERDGKIQQIGGENLQLADELRTKKEELQQVRVEKLEMGAQVNTLQNEVADLKEQLKRKHSPSQK